MFTLQKFDNQYLCYNPSSNITLTDQRHLTQCSLAFVRLTSQELIMCWQSSIGDVVYRYVYTFVSQKSSGV
jgi:hypothetical protein